MPERTPEERVFIDSLPIKAPDKYCNARTPRGYCGKTAGFGTEHKGTGRCKFHGGRAGRNITHGLYSKKITSTVKKEFDKLVKNPLLVDLYGELALTKTLMSNLLENLESKLSNTDSNWWIQSTKNGKVISAEANAMMKVLDTLGKLYTRIVEAEKKSQESLTPKDVYIVINQIKVVFNETCGECPVRGQISKKLNNTRMANLVEFDEAEIVSESKNKT